MSKLFDKCEIYNILLLAQQLHNFCQIKFIRRNFFILQIEYQCDIRILTIVLI